MIFSDFFRFFPIFSDFFRFFQKKFLDIFNFFFTFFSTFFNFFLLFNFFFTIQSYFNTIFTRALDLHLSLVYFKRTFWNFHFWKNLNFCSESLLHLFSSLWINWPLAFSLLSYLGGFINQSIQFCLVNFAVEKYMYFPPISYYNSISQKNLSIFFLTLEKIGIDKKVICYHNISK